MQKCFLIAGEASGDLHAAGLMREMKAENPNIEFRFYGGENMQKIGGKLLKHYKEMAFMGIWEVLQNAKTIKNNLDECKKEISQWLPDCIILIDYPGFNLKIAEFAHNQNIKVYYYISPKVWVWKKNRIKKIKKYIDQMFVIFPFEVDFYRSHEFPVFYFGNPSEEKVRHFLRSDFDEQAFREKHKLSNKPVIALLPGSRMQEIRKMMPMMIKVAQKFTDFQFVIAGMESIKNEVYDEFTQNTNLSVIYNQTFDLMRVTHTAIVTSGTATLETALFRVPQIVCYKTSRMSYAIGKMFVDIKYFSLVNILLKKETVKEFLQNDLEESITGELKKLTEDKVYRDAMLADYETLHNTLGKTDCSTKIAQFIVRNLDKKEE